MYYNHDAIAEAERCSSHDVRLTEHPPTVLHVQRHAEHLLREYEQVGLIASQTALLRAAPGYQSSTALQQPFAAILSFTCGLRPLLKHSFKNSVADTQYQRKEEKTKT